MNSMTIVLMLITGAVLVYCAVKGQDPRDLIKKALTGGTSGLVGAAGSAVKRGATGAAGSAVK